MGWLKRLFGTSARTTRLEPYPWCSNCHNVPPSCRCDGYGVFRTEGEDNLPSAYVRPAEVRRFTSDGPYFVEDWDLTGAIRDWLRLEGFIANAECRNRWSVGRVAVHLADFRGIGPCLYFTDFPKFSSGEYRDRVDLADPNAFEKAARFIRENA